jgi:hypothetical protein
VRNLEKSRDVETTSKAQAKWALLQSYDGAVEKTGLDSISDVRVAPLVQSEWGQRGTWVLVNTSVVRLPTYNYYTPGNPPDVPHYRTGCVATAMAQLMRYHEHPTAGVGTPTFDIIVDGIDQTASLRGGDGLGGPYLWGEMIVVPDIRITEAQRQAIGALCYDAGVSIGTYYTEFGSYSGTDEASDALTDTFGYGNAVCGWNNLRNIGEGLDAMVNCNLDANLPVLLAVSEEGGVSHLLVCDGYGYDTATAYHHLNMGWEGNYDAWYALPLISADLEWNCIDSCVYNIYTSGSGEIISGRVVGPDGTPASGVIVTAHAFGGETYYATTNDKGIYAIAKIPSDTMYFVTANKCGWKFDGKSVRTGKSNDEGAVSGNLWGVDFAGTVSSGYVEFERQTYVAPEAVTIRLIDGDLQGNGSHDIRLRICGEGEEMIQLTEYPANSGIFTCDVATQKDAKTQIVGTKRIIAIYDDQNDGTGNQATLRDGATVANEATTIYQTGFNGGLPSGWSIVDGFSDARTWNSDNLGGWSSPYWSGRFMIVDCQPNTIEMDEELVSRMLDCSGYDRVMLSFGHDFYPGELSCRQVGEVDVRVGGGAWQRVARYHGRAASGVVELDISAIAAKQKDVKIRWHFFDTVNDYYWGIDNVNITGVVSQPAMSCDLEPDCDVDFGDFSALAARWQETNCGDCDGLDLTGDGNIRADDLAELASHWLENLE